MDNYFIENIISEAILASHRAWQYFMRLDETQAMLEVSQVIERLEKLVRQVDYLLGQGISDQEIQSVFQLFPVLLAAMEQKNGLDLADLLEYELSPQLEAWLEILVQNGGTGRV